MINRLELELNPFGRNRTGRELTAEERCYVVEKTLAGLEDSTRIYSGFLRAQQRFLSDGRERDEGISRDRATEYVW